MRNLRILILFLVFLSACSASPTAVETPPPTASPTLQPTQTATLPQNSQCDLSPFIVPTMPARIPAGNELDETTGLHMTGSVQKIDLASYRFTVSGLVDHPLSLTIDQLRCMPRVTTKAVLNCGEIFTDSGTWSGVPIRDILEQAGVQAAATTVGLKSADGYLLLISMEDARDGQNFLAYEMEGKPLPILHGFPLRAVFPNHAGSRWVKWLVEIIVE